MFADVHVAISAPVGDHDKERILGTRAEGRGVVDSVKRVGLRGLKTLGKMSFFRGLERRGGAIGGGGGGDGRMERKALQLPY